MRVNLRMKMQTAAGGETIRSQGSMTASLRESVRSPLCSLPPQSPADTSLAGADVDPTAFLRAYNSHLEEDETLFPVDEDSQMAERGGEEDEEGGDGGPREMISRREVEAEIRKAAKEKVVYWVSTHGSCSDKFPEIQGYRLVRSLGYQLYGQRPR